MLEVQFDTFPNFETQRLLMREILPEDAESFFVIRTHPDVTRYLDRENEPDVDAVRSVIANIRKNYENGDGIAWAICLPGNSTMIGTISIWRIDKKNHRGEIGYSLLPEFWGKGLMSEAMEVVLRFGFQNIGLHSLEANTSFDNAASHALLRKFNFVQEAHFKENWHFRGKFYDSLIYSLLARNSGLT